MTKSLYWAVWRHVGKSVSICQPTEDSPTRLCSCSSIKALISSAAVDIFLIIVAVFVALVLIVGTVLTVLPSKSIEKLESKVNDKQR